MAEPSLRFRVEVDDRAILEALRAARRDMNQTVKRTMLGLAEARVLPHAKEIAPRVVARDLAVRATTNRVYLTFPPRLPKQRRATLAVLNFGGQIKTPLAPKKARALKLNDGSFVMSVTNPRTIRGKHFMEQAVKDKAPVMREELQRRLSHMLQQYIDGARIP